MLKLVLVLILNKQLVVYLTKLRSSYWPDLHQKKKLSNDSCSLFPQRNSFSPIWPCIHSGHPTTSPSYQSHDLITRPWTWSLANTAVLPSSLTYLLLFLAVDSFTTWQIYNFYYFFVISVETWLFNTASVKPLLNFQMGIKSSIHSVKTSLNLEMGIESSILITMIYDISSLS